jgi:hypothetical protein
LEALMLRARETFHANGRLVVAGGEVDEKDPIVSGREHLFEPAGPVVEQATAAPGEKRAVRTRKAAR